MLNVLKKGNNAYLAFTCTVSESKKRNKGDNTKISALRITLIIMSNVNFIILLQRHQSRWIRRIFM